MILVTAAILTVPSSVLQVSYAQTDQDMQTVLDVHNQERAAVGVQPLTWSNSLANDAQTWAQEIATTGNFDHLDTEHTGLTCTGPCYGENIAGFNPSLGPSAPGEGVSLWTAEKSGYNAQTNTCTPVPPSVSCGHYTQMVWQASLEVGCATAPPGAGGLHYSVLLCRYSPPGNGPGLPYGGPAQAAGEEDAAAPLQEEGAAGTFDDQGASAPLDAGGVGNDFGGGVDGGDGGENEN
jgi:pathogenesis-related protein 1